MSRNGRRILVPILRVGTGYSGRSASSAAAERPDSAFRRRAWERGSISTAAVLGLMVAMAPTPAAAMHITEGILPAGWAGLWYLVALPVVLWGLRAIRRRQEIDSSWLPMVALVGSAVFVISCMPVPLPGGTCSHPCGTGLAAVLIGPSATVVVASVALVIQALLLAHGGVTTLGANVVSMGIAGAFTAYVAFYLLRRLRVPIAPAVFTAGLLSDWATYTMTALQLAAGLAENGDFPIKFLAILAAFVPTQVPLGIAEGVLTAVAYRFVLARRPELLAAAASSRLQVRSAVLLLPFLLASQAAAADPPRWSGVDETVIEKFAEEAGHPAQEPWINTEQGDLPLFLFLTAGAIGGFVAGYTFRGLFPRRRHESSCGADCQSADMAPQQPAPRRTDKQETSGSHAPAR